MPIVVLRLSVLDFGPVYATDRQIDVRQTSDTSSLNAPPIRGGGIIIKRRNTNKENTKVALINSRKHSQRNLG